MKHLPTVLLLAAALSFARVAPAAEATRQQRDPLVQLLLEKGILTEADVEALEDEIARRQQPEAQPAPAAGKKIDWSFQYRLRPEGRRDNDLNKAASDNTLFAGQRIRVGAKYAPGNDASFFLQLQDTRAWGTERSTASNEQNLDVHQGYVDLANVAGTNLGVRLGRQELSFGDQRLLGAFGWSNVGRSFDAVKLTWPHAQGTLHFWGAQTKEGERPLLATGAPRADLSEYFYGLYNEWHHLPDCALDGYVLWRDAEAGSVDHWTVGGRAKGKVAGTPVDYAAELACQFGDQGATDFEAHAFAGSVGCTFGGKLSPRLSLEYCLASGDSNPADNKVETFDQLFPTNHNKYGFIDQVGWRNMNDLHVGLSVKPSARAKLAVDWHTFKLDEPTDSWYVAGGAPKLTDATGASGDDIGNELDLTLWYTHAPNQKYMLGYSRFFTGSYARNLTGVGDDTDWMFLQSLYDF